MTLCHIVPPYLMRKLAEAGDADLVRTGQRTLDLDQRFRAQRTTLQRVGTAARASSGRRWSVHTAANTETLPGDLVLADGGKETSDDVAVNEADAGIAATWDLLETVFSYRSFDGQGSEVIGTVHYGDAYDNAFWNGEQLVFGDGDQKVFDRFTKAVDVLGHELGHGVTQYTAKLEYAGQAGALNESISDVIGSMVKQRQLGQAVADADWLIGAGLFMPSVHGVALRSMRAPGTAYDDPQLGKDPQPPTMSGYVDTDEDNGGVHTNSGIPNHAFYLAATALGGNSWEGAGAIWWVTLTSGRLTADTDFVAFAQATIDAASSLNGVDSAEVAAVRDAWTQVEVIGSSSLALGLPGASSGPTSSPVSSTGHAVFVRRTGGVAGVAREGEVNLTNDPRGPEVAELLDAVDLREVTTSKPQPDQFEYLVRTPEHEVRLGERDLTPELARIVQLVLGD